MFDGRPSSGGPITHYIRLPLVLQTGLAPLHTNFHITPLAGADLILGDDWLAKYQATLDHARCRIQLTLPLFSPPVTSSNAIPLASPRHWFSSSTSDLDSSGATTGSMSSSLVFDPSIDNDTLLCAVSSDPAPSDLLDFDDLKTLGPQFSEILSPQEYAAETAELIEVVPAEFHDYIDIFRPSLGTKTLPPH